MSKLFFELPDGSLKSLKDKDLALIQIGCYEVAPGDLVVIKRKKKKSSLNQQDVKELKKFLRRSKWRIPRREDWWMIASVLRKESEIDRRSDLSTFQLYNAMKLKFRTGYWADDIREMKSLYIDEGILAFHSENASEDSVNRVRLVRKKNNKNILSLVSARVKARDMTL